MTRNYGISRREASFGGGYGKPPGSHTRGIYAPRDSVLLPPGNLSFPRSEFAQAVLDVFKLLCAFLIVSATGCGIAFAFFVLFFVRIG